MDTKQTHAGKQIIPCGKGCFTAGGILFFLGLSGIFAAAWFPGFAQWYAERVYPLLVSAAGRLMGLFPVSMVEIGLYLLLTGLATALVWTFVQAIRKGEKMRRFFSFLPGMVLIAGLLFFLYAAGCGINYRRASFSEESGLSAPAYSVSWLKTVCLWLTEEVNRFAPLVQRDEKGVMQLDAGEKSAAVEEMHCLAGEYPVLEGYYPSPKEVAVSEILSYQGITGVYSPFTMEANYNGDMTPYNVPFTLCHELSHLRGFMQEQEANFIVFLACEHAERIDFQYSGYLMAWIYSTNALYRADYEVWQEVRSGLDQSVEPDLEANSRFWDSYEGKVSEVANQINDTYLKVNGQSDGVKSYDRMVDLLVSYRKTEQGGRR